VAGLPARTLALIPISQRLLLSMSENCLAHRVSLLIIRRQNQKKNKKRKKTRETTATKCPTIDPFADLHLNCLSRMNGENKKSEGNAIYRQIPKNRRGKGNPALTNEIDGESNALVIPNQLTGQKGKVGENPLNGKELAGGKRKFGQGSEKLRKYLALDKLEGVFLEDNCI